MYALKYQDWKRQANATPLEAAGNLGWLAGWAWGEGDVEASDHYAGIFRRLGRSGHLESGAEEVYRSAFLAGQGAYEAAERKMHNAD